MEIFFLFNGNKFYFGLFTEKKFQEIKKKYLIKTLVEILTQPTDPGVFSFD
jgi:hypothetical protein